MAKRFLRTKTEDRPDLAAIGSMSQLDVKGYVFPKIFPLMPVTEKGGTITVAAAGLTSEKGVEDRSNGTTLNGGTVSTIDVDWTAVRIEGRSKMFENDASAYPTIEDADAAGAEDSQRRAWNKMEDKAFKKVFTATRKSGATSLTDHHVVKILQKTAKSLRKYGRPTLVMTYNTWEDFVEIPEIRYRLEKLAGAGNDLAFILTDVEKVRQAVSSFMHFADILIFDNEIVGNDYDGCIAVIGLRPGIDGKVIETVKTKAVYGFAPVYIPEDAPADKPFDMRSWYDDANKANVYDSEAYLNVIEVFDADGEGENGAAVKVCKMLDADEYTEYATSLVNVNTGTDAGGEE